MSRFRLPTVKLKHYKKSMQLDYSMTTHEQIVLATVIRSPIKMTTHTRSRTAKKILRKMTTRTWLQTENSLPKTMTTHASSQIEKQTRCSSRKRWRNETQ